MANPHQSLRGQNALVTGGSSGIGAAIVRCFAAAGAAVGINYRSNRESAEEIADEIRRQGGEAIALGADVSDEAQVQALFRAFLDSFGRIDVWWPTQASSRMRRPRE